MELEEEVSGAKIAVKRKKTKGKTTGRQTKLTSEGSSSSIKFTRPSAFAETIDPAVPEFNAEPKKTSGGRGRGKGKAAALKSEMEDGKSPERKAAAKAVKDAFGLGDDDQKTTKQMTLTFKKAPQKKKVESDIDDEDEAMDSPPPLPRQLPGRAKVSESFFIICSESPDPDINYCIYFPTLCRLPPPTMLR